MKQMSKSIYRSQMAINNTRPITLDVVSSISGDGKIINTLTHDQVERRNVLVVTPYGVASSALDNMMVQTMSSDVTGRTSMIGVYDQNKPSVAPGETVLYSNFGCMISMRKDGNIVFTSASGNSMSLDNIQAYMDQNDQDISEIRDDISSLNTRLNNHINDGSVHV